MRLSGFGDRLPWSFFVAAGLHVLLLSAIASPPASRLAANLDVSIISMIAPDPPSLPALPPPPPAPEAAPPSPAAVPHAVKHPSPLPATTARGETIPASPKSSDPAGDVPRASASADDILARLGAPRSGGASGGEAADDDSASSVPTVAPVPRGDYAHARITYPDEAIDALASGQVLLKLTVDAHGDVKKVSVVHHLGHGFDELAAQLVKDYKFHPARNAQGQPLAAQIGWRMSFAEWSPIAGAAPATSSGGMVPLESIEPPPPGGESAPARSGGDGATEGAHAGPGNTKPAALMTPEEVKARPIAKLSEGERHDLCVWQIRIRGGVHPDQCYGGPTREDELSNMVGSGRLDSNGGHWVREQGDATTLSRHTSKKRPGDDVMIFVKPEAECVHDTHLLDACGATVGLYTECMTQLAAKPCDWAKIPACYRLGKECP